jgi:hypothetical protein
MDKKMNKIVNKMSKKCQKVVKICQKIGCKKTKILKLVGEEGEGEEEEGDL